MQGRKKEQKKETDGRMDRRTDGWTGGLTDKQTERETDKQTDDRQTDNTLKKFSVSQNFVENKFLRTNFYSQNLGSKLKSSRTGKTMKTGKL